MTFLFDKTANHPTESNINIPVNAALNADSPLQDVPLVNMNEAGESVKRSVPSRTEFTPPSAKIMKTAKRKADLTIAADAMLIQTLQNLEKGTNERKEAEETDGDICFCKSLVPILKGFSPKKNRYDKMKIQQLLFDIEFDESF